MYFTFLSGFSPSLCALKKILVDGNEVKEAKPGTTCVLELSGNKKVAYSKEDRFLLANLDLTQRFAGYGFSK